MKDKLKQFGGAKRGVSPVIGVVLMVAVVVILAAVIGAFVLGLGGDQQSTPQASFSVSNAGDLVMEGGDSIEPGNIQVTLDGTDQTVSASDTITAGTTVASLAEDASGTVRVIYTGSGESSTIWQTNLGGGSGGGGGGGGGA